MSTPEETYARLMRGVREGTYRLHLTKTFLKNMSVHYMQPWTIGLFALFLLAGVALVIYGYSIERSSTQLSGVLILIGDVFFVKWWRGRVRTHILQQTQSSPEAFDKLYQDGAVLVEVVSTQQRISSSTGDWKEIFQEE